MEQKPAALNTSIKQYLYRRKCYKRAIKERKPYLGKNHPMLNMYRMKAKQQTELLVTKIFYKLHLGWITKTKIFWRFFS